MKRYCIRVCAALALTVAGCSAASPSTSQAGSPSASAAQPADGKFATPQQAIEARTDVWGEAALQQPGGPTCQFFEKLLPPSATSMPTSTITPSTSAPPRRRPRSASSAMARPSTPWPASPTGAPKPARRCSFSSAMSANPSRADPAPGGAKVCRRLPAHPQFRIPASSGALSRRDLRPDRSDPGQKRRGIGPPGFPGRRPGPLRVAPP